MESTKTISFNGVEYNVYEIKPKHFDESISVASEELYLAFMKDLTMSKDAIAVDEQIYCFLPELILNDTEEKVLEYFDEYYD